MSSSQPHHCNPPPLPHTHPPTYPPEARLHTTQTSASNRKFQPVDERPPSPSPWVSTCGFFGLHSLWEGGVRRRPQSLFCCPCSLRRSVAHRRGHRGWSIQFPLLRTSAVQLLRAASAACCPCVIRFTILAGGFPPRDPSLAAMFSAPIPNVEVRTLCVSHASVGPCTSHGGGACRSCVRPGRSLRDQIFFFC